MVKNLDWHFLRHKPFRPATLLRRDSKNIGKMLRTLFLQNTSGGCFWRQSNAQLVNVISWITYKCIEYTVMNDWNGSVNNKIKHFKGQYTYDVHENSLLFKTPHTLVLLCLSTSKIVPTSLTLDVQFQTDPPFKLNMRSIVRFSPQTRHSYH